MASMVQSAGANAIVVSNSLKFISISTHSKSMWCSARFATAAAAAKANSKSCPLWVRRASIFILIVQPNSGWSNISMQTSSGPARFSLKYCSIQLRIFTSWIWADRRNGNNRMEKRKNLELIVVYLLQHLKPLLKTVDKFMLWKLQTVLPPFFGFTIF